ncbi:MAG: hypothetical protein NTZ15_18070 [Burkholderiales bacterium]|jgi:hypothetical protein|nr:hypothetical protein [Burkholderiales bacterium]
MFAFLKRFQRPAAVTAQPKAEPPSRRMDLEERKAYRKERLYQSIRESFLSMEVVSNMYRFKLMPVDERHHRFIAMVDVAKSFAAGAHGKGKSFAAMEQSLRTDAFKRYGVLIDGVYWRVSETEDQFERRTRAGDPARSGSFEPPKPVAPVASTAANDHPPTPILSRRTYQPISAAEQAAFMEALQRGKTPPPVRVGEQEYQSDLMPLEGGSLTGGTQYGKLH